MTGRNRALSGQRKPEDPAAWFLHHRELLGGLAYAAWETVLELTRAAAEDEAMRTGMVAVVQTAGDLANWNQHVHAVRRFEA